MTVVVVVVECCQLAQYVDGFYSGCAILLSIIITSSHIVRHLQVSTESPGAE